MAGPRSKEEQQDYRTLLKDLGAGQAATEAKEVSPLRFYPVAEHVRAFDPDVALVVGEQGTGKSALCGAVFDHGLLSALARHAPYPRLPSGAQTWIQAYPLGRNGFPPTLGLRPGEGPEVASKLWFAYLIRALRDHLEQLCDPAVCRVWEPRGARPAEVLEAFDQAGDEPLAALDKLDERLEVEDRWIFVGYDELDTLGAYDWEVMRQALLGLVGFWASYSRRWRRLRAKIFLRTDLFRRHTGFGGADLAKLSANRAELTWNDRNLFGMLIKRIANADDVLLDYCRQGKIRFHPSDPELGHIPMLKSNQDAQPFVERLVGRFMGDGMKKGRTFYWILDHLRDARGHVAPRNLVRLLEHAALKEATNLKVRAPQLLHPTALRQALEDVSKDHVEQGLSHEWPWLDGLRERVRGNLMPMARRDVRDLLRNTWDGDWNQSRPIRPPVDTPEEFVDYLLELGVLRERTQERLDVPDIYLFGLGLKRKGGVRRQN